MNRNVLSCGLTALMLLAVMVFSTAIPAHAQDLILVAKNGDQAPGTPAGVVFSNLRLSSINSSGAVLIDGSLTGTGVDASNDYGVWTGPAGALQLVAREGDQAPGLAAGITLSNLSGTGRIPILSEAGKVIFKAFLGGPGVTGANDATIWLWSQPGTTVLIAREGDQAPGLPAGVLFGIGLSGILNATGEVNLFAFLTGTGVTAANDKAIWTGPAGALQLLVRDGDPAPGAPAGHNFLLNPVALPFGDDGNSAFASSLSLANPGQGIWAGAPGNLQAVVLQGDPAPEGPAGSTFISFGFISIRLTALGAVSFVGFMAQGGTVTTANDGGVWTGVPGALQLAIREGDQAPGTPVGTVFDFFGNSTLFPTSRMNANGTLLFPAGLTGPGVTAANDRGLWAGTKGNIVLVAREGDQAPGLAAGELFTSLSSQISINASADVLFKTSVTNNNDGILWSGPPDDVQPVFISGTQHEITPGVFRTLRLPVISGGQNHGGRLSSLSNSGHIAFETSIVNVGEGIFVIQPSNQAPVAICQNVTIDADASCQGDASVDNGSFDPDGDPVTLSQSPGGPYMLGDTLVTLSVTDDNGATSSCMATVTVEDNTPPVITTNSMINLSSPIVLWPPNHKYFTLTIGEMVSDVTDNCAALTVSDVVISAITSDEPEDVAGGGDGNTLDDILIAPNCDAGDIRVERQGSGNGRVYTFQLTVDDGPNVANNTFQAHVPVNKNSAAGDDGAAAGYTVSCP